MNNDRIIIEEESMFSTSIINTNGLWKFCECNRFNCICLCVSKCPYMCALLIAAVESVIDDIGW